MRKSCGVIYCHRLLMVLAHQLSTQHPAKLILLPLPPSRSPQVNTEIVASQRVITQAGEQQLKGLIQAHVEKTHSPKGKAILANWEDSKNKFWQLVSNLCVTACCWDTIWLPLCG